MANVIRFVFSGIDKGVQQLGTLRKSVNGVQSAGAGKVGAGGKTAGQTLAKLGAGAGMGGLGQIGAALGSPLGMLGVAAVGVGMSLRAMKGSMDASIAAIVKEVETRNQISGKMRDAVKGADQSAVSATLGMKDKLVGKSGRGGSPELRKFFGDQEKVQKQIETAQVERALKVGDSTARQDLIAVKSPEAIVLGEAFKEAQAQTAALHEIRDNMNWLQKTYEGLGNAASGRSWNAKGIDAMRNEAATVGGL